MSVIWNLPVAGNDYRSRRQTGRPTPGDFVFSDIKAQHRGVEKARAEAGRQRDLRARIERAKTFNVGEIVQVIGGQRGRVTSRNLRVGSVEIRHGRNRPKLYSADQIEKLQA